MRCIDEQAQCDVEISVTWDEPLDTALSILSRGWASAAEITEAVQYCRLQRPKIGELAVRDGKLTVAQVFRILEHEAVYGGLFGEIAVEFGYLCQSDLYELLQRQALATPRLMKILLDRNILSETQIEVINRETWSKRVQLVNCDLD